jgi:hypothetical protein
VNTVTAINMLGDQSVTFWKRAGTKRDDGEDTPDEDILDEDTINAGEVEENVFDLEKRAKCSINAATYEDAAKKTDKGGNYAVNW